jgi:TP901 family phage tail tape measure protein
VFGEDKTASATLDRVAKKANSTGQKLAGSLGVKIGIAGVGAALAGIASIGMAYEDSLNTFNAVSGATSAQMQQVAATAKALGNDLSLPATSAAGAATAMTELAKAGLSVADSMAAAKGTLALAAAAQVDEATAAQILGSALNAFSLQGKEATRVADLLAGAGNAASGEMTDMAAALTQVGTVAAAAGLSVDDTVAAISMLAQKGILGSDAGTSLKTMLMKLQGPSVKAAEELEKLGVNAYDASGTMLPLRDLIAEFTEKTSALTQQQRDQANATIFGTDATRAALTVLQGGVATFDDVKVAVTRSGQVFDTAAAKTKGLKGAFGGLQSTAETLAIDFYEKVAPGGIAVLTALTDLLAGVGPVVDGFGDMLVLGAELAGFLAEHQTAVVGLAAVYLATLAPALLATIRRLQVLMVLKVADFLGLIGTKADTAAAKMRGLSLAAVAATAGLAAVAMVSVELFQAWGKGADDAKSKVDELTEGMQFGDGAGMNRAIKQTEQYAKAQDKASRNVLKMNAWSTISALRAASRSREATRLVGEMSEKQAEAAKNVGYLSRALGISEKAVLSLAEKAGVDLADGTGAATAAVRELYFATVNGTPATERLAASTKVLGDEAASAEDQVKAMKDRLDAIFGIAMNVSEATDAYEAALDSLTESVKENGRSLDGTTEKGRANRDSLRALWQSTLDLADAQAAAGAPAEQLRAILEKGRQDLIKQATQLGLNKDKVAALTREINLTPEAIATVYTLEGAEVAIAKIDRLRRSMQELITTSGNAYRIVDGDMLGGVSTGETRRQTAAGPKGPQKPKVAPKPKPAAPRPVPRGLLQAANSGAALGAGGSASAAAGATGTTTVINLDGRHLATVVQGRDRGQRSRGLLPASP